MAADQLTKAIARATLDSGPVEVISGVFRLTLIKNPGGAFGILASGRWFFLALVAVFTAGVAMTLRKFRSSWSAVAVGLVLGGAVGNAVDRVFAAGGRVTDFLEIRYWPAFNVADIAVVAGCAMVFVSSLRRPVAGDVRGSDAEAAGSRSDELAGADDRADASAITPQPERD